MGVHRYGGDVCRGDDNLTRAPTTTVRHPITDLKTWLKAFATYVAVMSQKNGGAVPKVFDDLYGINNPGRRGVCGRCLGALLSPTGSSMPEHNLVKSKPSLFSLCFTGKAQALSRCDLCLSSSHETRECVWVGEGKQDVPAWLQAMEVSVEALRQGMERSSGRGNDHRSRDWQSKEDRCILFNQSTCYFRACHFRHACMICQGPHPAYSCNQSQGGGVWKGQNARRKYPY